MTGALLARIMLSVLAGTQGLTPLAIDLNRTHATNPLWPGHARFHVVWQGFTLLFAAVPEVLLVWWPGPGLRWRFYLAAVLTATAMAGFVAAVVLRRLYAGTFHDPNGIPPLRIRLAARTVELDGNALMVAVGLMVLATAVLLFRNSA